MQTDHIPQTDSKTKSDSPQTISLTIVANLDATWKKTLKEGGPLLYSLRMNTEGIEDTDMTTAVKDLLMRTFCKRIMSKVETRLERDIQRKQPHKREAMRGQRSKPHHEREDKEVSVLSFYVDDSKDDDHTQKLSRTDSIDSIESRGLRSLTMEDEPAVYYRNRVTGAKVTETNRATDRDQVTEGNQVTEAVHNDSEMFDGDATLLVTAALTPSTSSTLGSLDSLSCSTTSSVTLSSVSARFGSCSPSPAESRQKLVPGTPVKGKAKTPKLAQSLSFSPLSPPLSTSSTLFSPCVLQTPVHLRPTNPVLFPGSSQSPSVSHGKPCLPQFIYELLDHNQCPVVVYREVHRCIELLPGYERPYWHLKLEECGIKSGDIEVIIPIMDGVLN